MADSSWQSANTANIKTACTAFVLLRINLGLALTKTDSALTKQASCKPSHTIQHAATMMFYLFSLWLSPLILVGNAFLVVSGCT
jgi:hypothetical protein